MKFKDLISYDNIYLAFKRLQTVQRDYYKNLYWDDLYNLGLDIDKNIDTVISLLKEDLYKPKRSFKIYLPKSNNLVRPISVLNFIDLLIYQSIINILAEAFYEDFRPYYNRFVFGNIYNKVNNDKRIFFYKPWKNQWKKYEKLTKKHYNDGYKYITEFDLASFYDTIDHFLLKSILKEKGIENKVISILDKQLLTWTNDEDIIKNEGFKHGIPQGPLGSGFLGEICLHNIDKEMKKIVLNHKNTRYMRYVDDIRIFTKTKNAAQNNIAYLDLLARSLGFIPQANKIKIKKVDNIHIYIKTNKDFSRIANEFKQEGKLKSKDNRKYKKKLVKNLESGDYDKTLIKFSLYRLNKDEKIKSLLIEKHEDLLPYFESVCFYLSKHFLEDEEVVHWVNSILHKKKITFKYIIALLFKYFHKSIDFQENLFDLYYKNKVNWYIYYYFLDWINYHKSEWLNHLDIEKNYLIKKKKLNYQFDKLKDKHVKKSLLKDMLNSNNSLIALNGLKIIYHSIFSDEIVVDISNSDNQFIKNVAAKNVEDVNYLSNILKEKGVENAKDFFNSDLLSLEELKRLKFDFKNAEKYTEIDPNIWLIKIDSFNHLLVIITLKNCGQEVKKPEEYKNMLRSQFFRNNFPVSYDTFLKIHDLRCEQAHPFDREGDVNVSSTKEDYKIIKNLMRKEIKSLKEITESFQYIKDLNDEVASTKE